MFDYHRCCRRVACARRTNKREDSLGTRPRHATRQSARLPHTPLPSPAPDTTRALQVARWHDVDTSARHAACLSQRRAPVTYSRGEGDNVATQVGPAACSVSRSWNSVSDTTAVVRQSAGITNALHIDVGAVVLGLRHSARPVGDGDGAPGELEPDPDAADGDDTSINAEQSPDLLKNDARARRVDMGGRDGDSEFVRLASNTSVTEPVTSTAGDSERRWDDAMPWLTLGNGDDAAPVSSCSRTSTVSSKHQVMQLGHGRRNSS